MEATETMSQLNPSSTTGKEAVVDVAPAVAVTVEAKSLLPSTETPRKQGSAATSARHRRQQDRADFDRNTATALRVKNVGYESPIAAMFVRSTEAATQAERALAEKMREQELASRALNEVAGKVQFDIGRLLALCRYLSVDVDGLLARARLTLAQVRSRKTPMAIDAAFRLANLLMLPETEVPEALREEAKLLFKTARACSAALKASETHEPEMAPLRQAFAAAVKACNDDYWLLAAEIRHADSRQGTNWRGHLLMPMERTKRKERVNEAPVSNDPAELKDSSG